MSHNFGKEIAKVFPYMTQVLIILEKELTKFPDIDQCNCLIIYRRNCPIFPVLMAHASNCLIIVGAECTKRSFSLSCVRQFRLVRCQAQQTVALLFLVATTWASFTPSEKSAGDPMVEGGAMAQFVSQMAR